jgi:N-acetylglucosamine kinase-like BadF-type ATPase
MDIGGTATRVLIVDTGGRRRGTGRSGGANPTAHPGELWAGAVRDALGQALTESGPVAVGSVVVGVAGGGALADKEAAASFERIIRGEVRCNCRIQVTGDVVVAFTAGTAGPDGTVLVAGTGAAAAAIRDRSPVSEVDGHGWLLGDTGSGFWIGRKAVRAALAELDGLGPVTSLLPLVAEAMLGRDVAETDARRTCVEIVQAVHARPPVGLSKLAPLVSRCAGQGDQVAVGIVRSAVRHLVSAVEAVRSPDETTPIVVTGGVAVGDHLIAVLLRHRLESRWPTCVRPVHDGVVGAAWLALKALPGMDERKVAGLHHTLVQLLPSRRHRRVCASRRSRVRSHREHGVRC